MSLFEAAKRAELIASLVERLVGRRSSAFKLAGEDICRVHVQAAFDALERDIAGGKFEAMRPAAVAFVGEYVPEGLGYADLRAFTRQLRDDVLAALSDDERRAAVFEWCYEHLTVCSIHFMVKRDEQQQHQAAARDIQRYESQLDELRLALDEKTRLFELIRQASTPIAPVVPGILVVPLVGLFDRFRAELVTERLLEGVVRSRARVAILDISGVPVFDTESAQLTLRLARLVRLLGARLILVGMSPENARTIVDLGVELDGVVTCGTLQDGLREALASQNLKIVSIDA